MDATPALRTYLPYFTVILAFFFFFFFKKKKKSFEFRETRSDALFIIIHRPYSHVVGESLVITSGRNSYAELKI